MDSMSEADVIVVTDTGSNDKTVERLRNRGAIVFVEEIKPWRFDVARNISLSHVPEDADICICTDLDEILEKGWRQCIEEVWTSNSKRGEYIYNWSFKADGTPDVQFNYFKVHSRKDYIWTYPVHECINYIGNAPEEVVFIENMVLNHYPDNTKSRGSYLLLLELAVKESPENDRMAYYLGREYMYLGQWQKCIDALKKHLSLKSSTWNEERCASMRWIAHSYYKQNNIKEAYNWYYKAMAEASYMREPYVEFAKMAYELGEWALVFFLVDEALKTKEKSSTYINMGYSWDYTLYDLGAISCYNLKMYEKSLEYAKIALSLSPNDARLKNNLDLIDAKLKSHTILSS